MVFRVRIIHPTEETLRSYLGMLSHGNTTKIAIDLVKEWRLWQ